MSELKEVYAYQSDEIESLVGSANGNSYYLKSEADKVIAEKDKEITELEEKLNNSRNARKYWRKEYLIEYKECCNNKYKRCLAMAAKCEAWIRLDVSPRHTHRFIRWYKTWLAIAEKFKEEK